jgi:nitrite reductase/ring-hydroxylating ferredoxin subunit
MGSVEPDANGVITCPLHGLKVDAVSGVVLTPAPKPAPTFGEALAHAYESRGVVPPGANAALPVPGPTGAEA